MGTLRVTLRPASYYFLMQVAALVVMGTDNIVIGVFLGVSQVTAYAVAFQLWAVTLAILWTGVDALQPFFTRWDTTGDREKLREAYLRATKVAFAGAVLAAIVIAALGRQAIGAWVGRDLAVDRRVLWVFCGMLLTATPIHTASLVLAALGKHRPAAIGGVVEAALNLALSVALVRPLGVLGVALGTLLSGVVTNAWVAPLAAARALDIPVTTYVRRALLPAVLPALLGAGLVAALARLMLG
jgi:O-antigen/teichoic acid export membrane protein